MKTTKAVLAIAIGIAFTLGAAAQPGTHPGEKVDLKSLFAGICNHFCIPIGNARGWADINARAAIMRRFKEAERRGQQPVLLYCGDHDPSGVLIPQTIERRLEEFCKSFRSAPPIIERVALTKQQIEEYDLPTRPTKRNGNTHAHSFEGNSVELDALPAHVLRDLVQETIEQHISSSVLDALREAEASERKLFERWASGLSTDAGGT